MTKTHIISISVVTVIITTLTSGCGEATRPCPTSAYASPAAYRYQPLNPTTVWYDDPTTKDHPEPGQKMANWQSTEFKKALLKDLDNETVRISLDSITTSGKFSAGVVGTSVAGQNYVLVMDYIKYNSSCRYIETTYKTRVNDKLVDKAFNGRIPVYTGIGLRIKAEFTAHESNLNISGLPALSIAASTKGISGRLTVSTLGITGPDISPLMPIISDISVTSIQNAVMAMGAIKSKIYEPDTTVALKVIGYESPSTDLRLIKKLTEALYSADYIIYPSVSPNPEDPTSKLYWVEWELANSCNPEPPGQVQGDDSQKKTSGNKSQ